MCEPISASTAVALASAAASTGAGLWQTARANSDAKRAEQARSDAAIAELERQRGYRNEAQTTLTTALSGAKPEARTSQFNDAVSKRSMVAAGAAPPAGVVASMPNAPAIVRDNFAAASGKAGAEAAARTAALARVLAHGDVNTGRSIALDRSGQELSQLSGIAGVSNDVGRLEQDVNAANAQKGPNIFADGLQGIGNLGLMLALSGQLGGKKPAAPVPRLKPPRGT